MRSALAALIGVHRVRDVVLLMLMEFIVIHSSTFMGTAAWGGFGGKLPRGVAIVGLGLFYSLFVGGPPRLSSISSRSSPPPCYPCRRSASRLT
jgi:hypothetical protein